MWFTRDVNLICRFPVLMYPKVDKWPPVTKSRSLLAFIPGSVSIDILLFIDLYLQFNLKICYLSVESQIYYI